MPGPWPGCRWIVDVRLTGDYWTQINVYHGVTQSHAWIWPLKSLSVPTLNGMKMRRYSCNVSVNCRFPWLFQLCDVIHSCAGEYDWLAGAWSASERAGDSELCCRQLLCFRGGKRGWGREKKKKKKGEKGRAGEKKKKKGEGFTAASSQWPLLVQLCMELHSLKTFPHCPIP